MIVVKRWSERVLNHKQKLSGSCRSSTLRIKANIFLKPCHEVVQPGWLKLQKWSTKDGRQSLAP